MTTGIGIDYGTTSIKAAFVDATGKPVIAVNERGEPQTPSVVYVQEGGPPLVGRDAVEQGYVDPTRVVRNAKLQLGSTESLLPVGMPTTTPTDAVATVLAATVADLERAVGTAVTHVVATCPANFRDDSKQALNEAFESLGIKVLKLLPEPTAAAFAHHAGQALSSETVVVFDFGGGTLDVSVVQMNGDQMTVLATEGVPRLGGNDLTKVIVDRILDEIEERFGERPTREADALAFQEIDFKSESTKLSLSKRDKVSCVVSYKGNQVVVEFTQDGFHKAIAPLVRQSLDATDRAVVQAGLDYGSLSRVVMAGGTSRSPYVQHCVKEHTGLPLKLDSEPDKLIARGAALDCVRELVLLGEAPELHGRAIPAPRLFVRDVTAHDVGCAVVDGSNGHKRIVNSVIVPKSTPIPHQKADAFYLESEHQTDAKVEVLQGGADADRDTCLIIGELVLENLPTEPVRTKRIQIVYTIDGNGMVNVTATDKVSGVNKSISVDYRKGVKPKSQPAKA